MAPLKLDVSRLPKMELCDADIAYGGIGVRAGVRLRPDLTVRVSRIRESYFWSRTRT